MEIYEDNNSSTYQITHYDTDTITINDTAYGHSLIVSANHFIPDWPVQTPKQLSLDSLTPAMIQNPETLLIGIDHCEPDFELLNACRNEDIPLEWMNLGAACRTFSILSAEGRHVVACLILPAQ